MAEPMLKDEHVFIRDTSGLGEESDGMHVTYDMEACHLFEKPRLWIEMDNEVSPGLAEAQNKEHGTDSVTPYWAGTAMELDMAGARQLRAMLDAFIATFETKP